MSALRGTPNGLEPQAVVCLTWWHVAPLSGEKWHTFKVQCQGLKTQTAEKCFIYGNGGFHGGALLYRTYN